MRFDNWQLIDFNQIILDLDRRLTHDIEPRHTRVQLRDFYVT